jgi:serine/threonine-protein kinase
MLYELLTGQLPYGNDDAGGLCQRICAADPPRPRSLEPGLDPELERITLKCLDRDPAGRYPSVDRVAADLRRWVGRREAARRRRRWARWTGVAAAACLGTMAVAALLQRSVGAIPSVDVSSGDPDRVMRDALASLARGEPAELLGERGAPGWLRVPVGETWAQLHHPFDDSFTVTTQSLALVELLPEVPAKRFRFRVQVRAHGGSGPYRAGLYVGRAARNAPDADVHSFLEWSFSESDAAALRAKKPPPAPGRHWGAHAWEWRAVRDPGDHRLQNSRHNGGHSFLDVPAVKHAARAPWRELVVEAGPDGYRFGWAGAWPFRAPLPPPQTAVGSLRKAVGEGAPLGFAPGGGLGLYVFGGSASFRSAAVLPLPD